MLIDQLIIPCFSFTKFSQLIDQVCHFFNANITYFQLLLCDLLLFGLKLTVAQLKKKVPSDFWGIQQEFTSYFFQ